MTSGLEDAQINTTANSKSATNNTKFLKWTPNIGSCSSKNRLRKKKLTAFKKPVAISRVAADFRNHFTKLGTVVSLLYLEAPLKVSLVLMPMLDTWAVVADTARHCQAPFITDVV